jgi:excisionase family DNA binding protein
MSNEKEAASSSRKSATKHRNRYDPLRDQFYTCDELAEMLGVKPDTIAGHARSGRLPACQPFPQGVWLFPKDELAAMRSIRAWKTRKNRRPPPERGIGKDAQ